MISDTQQINVAELDAMLREINLELKWQAMVLDVNTDSLCVYHWVTNALMGKSWFNTKDMRASTI